MSTLRASQRHDGPSPWIIAGIGVLLANVAFWYVIEYDFIATSTMGTQETMLLKSIELVLMVVFPSVLIYAGYHLATSKYEGEQIWWVSLWCILGLAGIVSVIVLVHAHQIAAGEGVDRGMLIEHLLMGAGGGAIAGLLIGLSTAQAMWNKRQVAEQRNSFAFLNKVLRHNVLNGIQIIHGHARLLEEDVDGEAAGHIETIATRSDSIADLTQNARMVAGTVSGETSLTAVDLVGIVEEELETVNQSHPGAVFTTDLPEAATVQGNEALSVVVSNVLENAVEHNDADEPHVHTTIAKNDSRVVLRVADNGPGVPDDRKEEIFDPGEHGDHGFGLYLVNTLVEHCGGYMWVEDNEPRGAVFVVEFRPADEGF